jgi:ankyrin repeat protein
MNWLIIANSQDDENLIQLRNFLENKHGVIPYEIIVGNGLPKDELFEASRHVSQATHCLVTDSSKMENIDDYVFLMGALCGNNVKTYIYQSKAHDDKFEVLTKAGLSHSNIYNNLSELQRNLEADYQSFERADNQKQALVQLFTLGIPFTSDCYATYIAKDDTDICKLFADAGMLCNARTSEGTPLISIATRNDCADKVAWLYEQGADINAISTDRGYSPVMDAVWRKNLKITEYLISKGADLNFISSDGQPIMVLAVGNGDAKIVELLLNHGADPDLKDSMGMSARTYASLFKRPDLVELINKYPPKDN